MFIFVFIIPLQLCNQKHEKRIWYKKSPAALEDDHLIGLTQTAEASHHGRINLLEDPGQNFFFGPPHRPPLYKAGSLFPLTPGNRPMLCR